nr:ImmA/IrrE family metallo-endopeptidase [Azospirillum argentinense]
MAEYVDSALAVLPARSQLPNWMRSFSIRNESFQEAHRVAHDFRAAILPDRQDDPLHNLPQIMEELGGVIVSRLHKSRYEGASIATNGYGFAFVSPRFAGRMLFTLAHELGHLLAHHSNGAGATFDLPSEIGAYRHKSKSEAFVDAFAAILLLPDRAIGKALREIRSLYKITASVVGDVEISILARYYGVSFDVAALRCEQLELLPLGGAYSLSQRIKKEYGSAEKRAEELGLPTRMDVTIPQISPSLLLAIVNRIEAGDVSAGWASERFDISISDIYSVHAELDGSEKLRH